MATTHTNLTVGKTYAVTSASGCTVTLANGVQLTLEAGQDYFTPDTPDVVISDDDATLVLLFNHAPGRRGSGGSVAIDPSPTQGSTNAVSSGGVYTALQGKQDTLTAGDGIALTDDTIAVDASGAVAADDTLPVSGETVAAALEGYLPLAAGVAPEVKGNVTFSGTSVFSDVSAATFTGGVLKFDNVGSLHKSANSLSIYKFGIVTAFVLTAANKSMLICPSCICFGKTDFGSNVADADIYGDYSQTIVGSTSKTTKVQGTSINLKIGMDSIVLNAADLLKLRQILDNAN